MYKPVWINPGALQNAHYREIIINRRVVFFIVNTEDAERPTIYLSQESDTGILDKITTDTTPTLFGSAIPNSSVSIKNSTTEVGTALSNSSGVWQFTAPELDVGVYQLTASTTVEGVTKTSLVLTIQIISDAPPAEPSVTLGGEDVLFGGDTVTWQGV